MLREQGGGHGEALAADAAMTLEAGGKRLRPLLVLLCAGEEGGAEAVRAATAIELIHMATLVHDDVLDAAPLRRGRPTVAATSGRDRATATGDLLFSRAFALLAAAGDLRSIELLSGASVALARGELAQRQDAYDTSIGEERYLERCRLKTATLFECACLLGRDEQALGDFGAAIGLAFQLLDDVLDVAGPPERTGKARGTDLLDGTVTLPLILAAERDPAIARRRPARASTPPAPRRSATGSRRAARCGRSARARWRWSPKASARLGAAGFDAERRKLFDLVADGVVQRYSLKRARRSRRR